MSSPSVADDGTELGANTASGIALGNRVKMRGFVDRYDYTDLDTLATDDDARFRSAADIDFLFDFSPFAAKCVLLPHQTVLGLNIFFSTILIKGTVLPLAAS